MIYLPELNFFQKILRKFHIESRVFDIESPLEEFLNFGLKTFLSLETIKNKTIKDFLSPTQGNTIYEIKDFLGCSYIIIPLPTQTGKTELLSIGPFLTKEISEEDILVIAEKYTYDQKTVKQLKFYFSNIPTFTIDDGIFNVIDTFAESIYGSDYTVKNISQNFSNKMFETSLKKDTDETQNIMLNMQIIENRYSFENQMMQAVSKGLSHKAELMLSGFSRLAIETRLSDPLRNVKNYCIIMNTLLRKSAEQGGVHPIYLDNTSSDFARKIELLNSIHAVQGFMINMFKTYCELVKKHSTNNYPPCVQKVIIAIDSDLTADLTLNALSKMQNISAGYLSTLFKKETGQTLTDFVNTKRVEHAILLLKTTNLQIQTIAQYCGIYDIQYFSKIFKKYTNKTPKEFRNTN